MALRYFTLSSSLCAETIGGAWEVRLEKNMERVRAMLGISFYLYEVGSARAPKGFPWWTAGMKIDPRVPNTLIRKDYSIVNFTNIYSVSTQIRYLSKPQKWYSAQCLGSIGEGQTQGLVVVAHAGGARERLARRAPCAAGAAVWSRVDPRARPAPPSSRGGAAGKARPLVRLGDCCPLKRLGP